MLRTVSKISNIDFAPGSIAKEVMQNVRTLISTPINSVPLDRDFGIDLTALDNPTPMTIMRLRVEIVQKINRYEPRAVVRQIDFKLEPNAAQMGTLIPVVTLEITNE